MKTSPGTITYRSGKLSRFLPSTLLVLSLIVTQSCNDSTSAGPAATNIRHALLNGIDPSGTAIGAGWPNPPREFYTRQISWLERNGGGILVIYNMSLKLPKELAIEVDPLLPIPRAMDVGEERLREVLHMNDSLTRKNNSARNDFFAALDSFIIAYDPESSADGDLSFIDNNLEGMIKKLNEPSLAGYRKHVFLYTDLLNEPGKKIKLPADSALIEQLRNSGADIAACYLLPAGTENEAIKNLKAVPLSSYIGYLNHLDLFTTKISI